MAAGCRRTSGFSDVEQAALQRALDALRQGDHEVAASLALDLARTHSSAGLAAIAGVAQLRAGKHKEAIATLERAQALDPANADVAVARVRAYLAADKPDKARQAARLAQATLVDDTPFSRAIAAGGLDRAKTAEAMLRVGQELLRTGQSAGALALFHEAAVLAPKSATAQLLVGSALYNLKSYARAVQSLQRAVQMGAPASGAWKLIGHSLTSLGDNRGALEAYQQVLRLAPSDGDARNAVARLSGQPPPGPAPSAPPPGAPAAAQGLRIAPHAHAPSPK